MLATTWRNRGEKVSHKFYLYFLFSIRCHGREKSNKNETNFLSETNAPRSILPRKWNANIYVWMLWTKCAELFSTERDAWKMNEKTFKHIPHSTHWNGNARQPWTVDNGQWTMLKRYGQITGTRFRMSKCNYSQSN